MVVSDAASEPVRAPPDPSEPFLGQASGSAYRSIELDYPVTPRMRWGGDRPSHPQLTAILERGRDGYRALLRSFVDLRDELCAIPVASPDPAEPCWVNGWLPGLDSAALYALLTQREPSTYLEVGSGNSTKFARRAIRDHGLETRLVSIDPEPRAEIDALCDEVVRERAEAVDLAVYTQLHAGDVLFVDNSHRSLQNSDATAILLDVLPRLEPGVLVEFHDITLPDDYPEEWFERFYSEQYVLAAFLLAEGPKLEVVLPNHFVSHDPELRHVLDPLWSDPRLEGVERHGGSFWLATR